MMNGRGRGSFEAAADEVSRRLVLRQALELANRSAWPVAAGAALLVVWGRRAFPEIPGGGLVLAAGGALVWVLGCLILAWRRRPDRYDALARWDAVSAEPGSLAAAVWFAAREHHSPGEELHLREARRILEARLPHAAAELPVGRPARTWWTWALVPVIFLSGLGQRNLGWEEKPLAPALQADLATWAESLADRKQDVLEAAKAAEAEGELSRSAALEKILEETGALAASGGETATAGEMLEALEARARAVEALAKEFHGDADWLPRPVVEELARHADTGGLAAEVKERRASAGASEAERLAESVGGEAAAVRIQHALRSALEATPRPGMDSEFPVLRHLTATAEHLARRETEKGATELRALAETFRAWAQKKAAREQLESLARQIRGGGDRLAGAAAEGPKETGSGPMPPTGAEELGAQAPPSTPLAEAAPGPGAEPGDGSTAGPAPPGGPLPGQGLEAPVPVPGTEGAVPAPLGGSVALQAPDPTAVPVPGMEPGEEASASAGGPPVPGQTAGGTPGGNPGGQPGLHAGEGMAELRPNPTKPMGSGRDDLVVAAANAEGRSERRTVEAEGASGETSTRGTQETDAEFGAVDEAAMDEAALPAGRREQVRRYFTVLRQRQEGTGGTPVP